MGYERRDTGADVISHYPQPRFQTFELANRVRLPNVECSEQQKCGNDTPPSVQPEGARQERNHLSRHFVNHDYTWIFSSKEFLCAGSGPDPRHAHQQYGQQHEGYCRRPNLQQCESVPAGVSEKNTLGHSPKKQIETDTNERSPRARGKRKIANAASGNRQRQIITRAFLLSRRQKHLRRAHCGIQFVARFFDTQLQSPLTPCSPCLRGDKSAEKAISPRRHGEHGELRGTRIRTLPESYSSRSLSFPPNRIPEPQ